MDTLSMCRICLAEDVRMQNIHNTGLQKTFERLTSMPLETKDRPLKVCYICWAKLQNCYQLQTKSLQSEEIFAQMLEDYKFQLPLQDKHACKIEHPVIDINIDPDAPCDTEEKDNVAYVDIKVERLEMLDDVKVKEEPVEAIEHISVDEDNDEFRKLKDSSETDDCDASEYCIQTIKTENEVAAGTEHEVMDYNINLEYPAHAAEPFDESYPVPADSLGSGNIAPLKITKKKLPSVSKKRKALKGSTSDTSSMNFQDVSLECINNKPWSTNYGKKPYKCDICGKSFSKKERLTEHLKVHGDEKSNKCSICGKYFSIKNRLKIPVEGKPGETLYKCELCVIDSQRHSNLRERISANKAEKPYKCDVCEEKFCSKTTLYYHNRIHTGVKLFKCDVCGRCFVQKCHFNEHILIHVDAKPYKCNICGKAFSRRNYLKIHARVHTGEKPYKCEHCTRCFRQRSHLYVHIRTHCQRN